MIFQFDTDISIIILVNATIALSIVQDTSHFMKHIKP